MLPINKRFTLTLLLGPLQICIKHFQCCKLLLLFHEFWKYRNKGIRLKTSNHSSELHRNVTRLFSNHMCRLLHRLLLEKKNNNPHWPAKFGLNCILPFKYDQNIENTIFSIWHQMTYELDTWKVFVFLGLKFFANHAFLWHFTHKNLKKLKKIPPRKTKTFFFLINL